MYSRLRLAEKYLRYYLTAANGKGHGIHSPFVYDLVRSVLCDKSRDPAFAVIEGLRRRLLRDGSVLEVEDLGAGAVRGRLEVRRVAEIARNAAKPARLGQLLFRLAKYYRPRVVVELGTSLGLSTAYLAAGAADAKIWTIEGSVAVAERASVNLAELGFGQVEGSGRVEVVKGNFDAVLEPLLERTGPVELAFVDGNHRCGPTLRYFDILMRHSGRASMLIFDDIHWSTEMERAWAEIKADPRVMLTIDLFFLGLVVRRDEFKVKQDFTIRF
ncbi:MAG TPA: class I SAM-dependent methyltransferase [Puia sp.]|nr:class I SAM-dependent methyltransferase [Puia sp.]